MYSILKKFWFKSPSISHIWIPRIAFDCSCLLQYILEFIHSFISYLMTTQAKLFWVLGYNNEQETKITAFMALSFSTQLPAIFLNETDYITPYLKPSNNFSLHGDKSRLLTIIYKARPGWSVTFLYLHSYSLHSRLTCPLASRPLYLHSLAHILFYQISAWWSASYHTALSSNDSASEWPSPTTHGQSMIPQSLFPHVLTLISSKPLSV